MFGVDVSNHNGDIAWETVKKNIDFAIIRGGYANTTVDARAHKNLQGCVKNNIPFGIYWFSYALSIADARKEANSACDLADKYHPQFPICYDWEYDSDNYAKRKGITITNNTRKSFAVAFLSEVEKRGYTPMLYTNIDYLSKGFSDLTPHYDIWLAQWGVKAPSRNCSVWQSSSTGKVNGISGNVDTNYSYKSFGIANKTENKDDKKLSDTDKEKILKIISPYLFDTYYKLALDIMKGVYSNGAERKAKLKALGYDYEIAQAFVNYLIK